MKKIYELEVRDFGKIYVVRPSARMMEPFVIDTNRPESERNWFGMADIVANCLVKGPEDDTRRYKSRDELLDEMDAEEYLAIAPAISNWNNERLRFATSKNLPKGGSSPTNSPLRSDTPVSIDSSMKSASTTSSDGSNTTQ